MVVDLRAVHPRLVDAVGGRVEERPFDGSVEREGAAQQDRAVGVHPVLRAVEVAPDEQWRPLLPVKHGPRHGQGRGPPGARAIGRGEADLDADAPPGPHLLERPVDQGGGPADDLEHLPGGAP